MNSLEAEAPVERPSIWQELDSWAAEFKPWQHFLLAHCICEGPTLSEKRLEEAYYLLLLEFGLVEPRTKGVEIPADITGRPATLAAAKVSIAKLGKLNQFRSCPASTPAPPTLRRRLRVSQVRVARRPRVSGSKSGAFAGEGAEALEIVCVGVTG
jgi:hypothetical protein